MRLSYVFLVTLVGLATVQGHQGTREQAEVGEEGVEAMVDAMLNGDMVDSHLIDSDTEHFLEHLNTDIEQFRQLKDRVHHLQGVMAVHVERRAMAEMAAREPPSEEVQDAQFVLGELDHSVLEPFEESLVLLRKEMMAPHDLYDARAIKEITSVIQMAELFLKSTKERVEEMEEMEEEWEEKEDADDVISDALLPPIVASINKQVFRKKEQKPWGEELRQKLEEEVEVGVPEGKQGRMGVAAEEGGVQRRKKLVKEQDMKRLEKERLLEVQMQEMQRREMERAERERQRQLEEAQDLERERLATSNLEAERRKAGEEKDRLASSTKEAGMGDSAGLPSAPSGRLPSAPEVAEMAADILEAKLANHRRVIEVAGRLPSYVFLAVATAALLVLLGVLVVLHRVHRGRSQDHGSPRRGTSWGTSGTPWDPASSTSSSAPWGTSGEYRAGEPLLPPSLAPRTSGYREMNETKETREANKKRESEAAPGGWAEVADLVTPFRLGLNIMSDSLVCLSSLQTHWICV